MIHMKMKSLTKQLIIQTKKNKKKVKYPILKNNEKDNLHDNETSKKMKEILKIIRRKKNSQKI